MSRVIVEGHPPSGVGLLAELDAAAAAAAAAAGVEVETVVTAQVPHGRTGRLAAATKPRVRRTPTGYSLTVSAPRGARHGDVTVAKVARWVQQGTGLYRTGGGAKHPIRSTRPFGRMVLPGGKKVRKVKGQQPNPYLGRIAAAGEPIVLRAFETGAHKLGGRSLR